MVSGCFSGCFRCFAVFSCGFLLEFTDLVGGLFFEGLFHFRCEGFGVSPAAGDGGSVDDEWLSPSSGGFMGVLPAVDGGYWESGVYFFEEPLDPGG